jgi:Tfp pilus assembly protein PilE
MTRRPARTTNAGFTLLEVMLVAVLATVILSALWAVLGTYEKLFTRGQSRMERAQLLLSVSEQIRTDLQSTIPDTATTMPGATASVRRFGLFGSERSVQLDVLQIATNQLPSLAAADADPSGDNASRNTPSMTSRIIAASAGDSGSDRSPKAFELRTIQYRMKQPAGSSLAAAAEPSGLVRRELDWETPTASAGSTGSPRPRMASAASVRGNASGRQRGFSIAGATTETNALDGDSDALDPNDPTTTLVPEVANLSFRYYDGGSWSTDWNSLTRHSLPVAVEVTISLANPDETASAKTSASAKSGVRGKGTDVAASNIVATNDSADAEKHQFVVFLSSTALAKSPESRRPSAFGVQPSGSSAFPLPPPGPPPAAPRNSASPGPRPPRGASPNQGGNAGDFSPDNMRSGPSQSDQWMRSGR